MESDIVTLDQILEQHEFVLVDTSESSCSRISKTPTNKQGFSSSELRSARKDTIKLEQFHELLQAPNTYTISEVTKELERFYDKVDRRAGMAFRRKGFNIRDTHKVNRMLKKLNERNAKQRKSISPLKRAILRSAELSKQCELVIDDPGYKGLTDLVIDISKAKNGTWYHKAKPPYTDEKLVTTLLWLSITKQTPPALVAKDKGISFLLGYTKVALGSNTFLPDNDFFRQEIRENPGHFYHKKSKNYGKLHPQDKLVFQEVFLIKRVPAETSKKIRTDIREFWEQYA